MSKYSPTGQKDDLLTRPERRFETRRGVLIVLLVLPVLCLVFLVARGCMSPMAGTEKVFASSSVATVTMVPALQQVTPVPVATVSEVVAGVVQCYALADVPFSSGVIPVNARVSVSGYSFVSGGRVYVVDPAAGWQDAGLFRCNGDLRLLEKVFFFTATPAASATPEMVTPAVTDTPRIVYRVGPTYTPYPTYTPFPSEFVDGVYQESSGCWRFDVRSVREIWVNGATPVAGGSLVCGVTNFRVEVGR